MDSDAGPHKTADPEQRRDARPGDDGDDGPRPFGVFPLLVLLVLVVGGLLLLLKLRDDSRVQDCVWSGRKNCAPIDVPSAP